MARVELLGQPYAGKSIIASGQECVNLYPEINKSLDPQAPSSVSYYPTPGSVIYADPHLEKIARASYRTSVGTSYYVVGPNVYYMADNSNVLVLVGFIPDANTPVIFADNGIVAVLVNGDNGWAIDLTTNDYGAIVSAYFYGASYVLFLDTFFIFNRPDTNQFYLSQPFCTWSSLTGGTAFDPLDIAAKAGFSDKIVALATVHRELWLIGALTCEVWIGTGAADFYFQLVQGAFINHGCIAPYSVATTDIALFFLMQDPQGYGMVVKGNGYTVDEISTPRIVTEFKSYGITNLSEAIGFTFQMEDHVFYGVVFPSANKSWLWEMSTGWWAEWGWTDDNGNLNRCRANCMMYSNGRNLVGDWENGRLLELDANLYTDDDGEGGIQPIVRIRTFPHSVDNNQKISYSTFQADMECGTETDLENNPVVALSWSDDKGRTYGTPIEQTLGQTGHYLTSPQWSRLGEARDRIFKLQWSAAVETALNGAFITTKAARK